MIHLNRLYKQQKKGNTMNKQQQMKQILKETIDYYAKDPDNRRSVDKRGNCRYTLGDKHCAIGRYLKEEYQREDWIENVMSVNELCESSDAGWNIDWCLREDVQGLDADFWSSLQGFHDSQSCWVTEECCEHVIDDESIGLSRIGKDKYRTIEKKINMGGYHD